MGVKNRCKFWDGRMVWRRPWAKKFIDRQNFSSTRWYKKWTHFFTMCPLFIWPTSSWLISIKLSDAVRESISSDLLRFFFTKWHLPTIWKERSPQILYWQTTFSSLGHVVSNMSTLYLLVNEKKVIVVLKMPVNDSLTLSIFILYVFNVGERILSTILVHTMHNPLAKSNPSSMGKGVVFMTSRVRWCFFSGVFFEKLSKKRLENVLSPFSVLTLAK